MGRKYAKFISDFFYASIAWFFRLDKNDVVLTNFDRLLFKTTVDVYYLRML